VIEESISLKYEPASEPLGARGWQWLAGVGGRRVFTSRLHACFPEGFGNYRCDPRRVRLLCRLKALTAQSKCAGLRVSAGLLLILGLQTVADPQMMVDLIHETR